MLCNFEDEMEGASDATACPDFEVVSPIALKCARCVTLPSFMKAQSVCAGTLLNICVRTIAAHCLVALLQ
jgi:hypothetical protein